jgi:Flp pilus assembly protein TadB
VIAALFVFSLLGWLAACCVVVLWDRSEKRHTMERLHLTNLAVAKHPAEAALLNRSLEPKPQLSEDDKRRQPAKPYGL